MDNIKFGKFMIELRREKNMTQKQLAEKLNITDKAISKWERGLSFPDIIMLKPLAELFNVSVIELLNGEKENNEKIDINEKIVQALKQIEEEKKKKVKKIQITCFLSIMIAIIIFAVVIFSKIKFHTYNPIRALIGYTQIQTFDKEYVEVGNIPNKTIYAKEEFNFTQYMENRGFREIKEEQLGYQRVFTNGKIKEYIIHWTMLDGYPFMILEWENSMPDHGKKNVEEQTNKIEEDIQIPIINMNTTNVNEVKE